MPAYRKKQYKRRAPLRRKRAVSLAPKTAVAVKAIVKRQMKRVVETKNADWAYEPFPAAGFYHNVWNQIDADPFYTQQGVEDSMISTAPNRIGDSIYSKNIWRKLLITKFNDRCNLVIRIVILKMKGSVPVPADITNNSQLQNRIVAPLDLEHPAILKCVYDRVFVSNDNVFIHNTTGGVPRDTKFYWNHNHRTNEKVTYNDGDFNAQKHTYRLFVCCYDTQNALTTDNVARFSYYRRHHFEDA